MRGEERSWRDLRWRLWECAAVPCFPPYTALCGCRSTTQPRPEKNELSQRLVQCQTGWRKPNLGHLPTVCHGCADRYRGFGWGKHDSFGFRQGDSGPEIGCSCKSLAHGTRLPWSALGRVWDADPAPTSLQPWINHVIQLHALLLFALTFFFSFPPCTL